MQLTAAALAPVQVTNILLDDTGLPNHRTVNELASSLRINPRTIRNTLSHIRAGRVPADRLPPYITLGSRVVFPLHLLQLWSLAKLGITPQPPIYVTAPGQRRGRGRPRKGPTL